MIAPFQVLAAAVWGGEPASYRIEVRRLTCGYHNGRRRRAILTGTSVLTVAPTGDGRTEEEALSGLRQELLRRARDARLTAKQLAASSEEEARRQHARAEAIRAAAEAMESQQ